MLVKTKYVEQASGWEKAQIRGGQMTRERPELWHMSDPAISLGACLPAPQAERKARTQFLGSMVKHLSHK